MGAMRGGAERGGAGAGGGGEIVQVQGGHILRSIGRKDRHSKVYTAKGPRDRRVRLSAHTAIQFYDVQDRLGYDRPSKAVDWLIKNAKSAIDKLAQLPPWHPNPNPTQYSNNDEDLVLPTSETAATCSQSGVPEEELESSDFVPPPTQIDPMMDMMISSRGGKPCSEDLGLSLHPFEVPSGRAAKWDSGPAGFAFETDSYPRAGSTSWSNDSSAENTRDGFLYSTNDNLMAAVPFPPRGTLQSSTPPALHAFDGFSIGPEDHHKAQAIIQQPFLFGNRFGSDVYPGFSLPAAQQINDEDDCNISFSRQSSFYAWSNSGHSLLKRK